MRVVVVCFCLCLVCGMPAVAQETGEKECGGIGKQNARGVCIIDPIKRTKPVQPPPFSWEEQQAPVPAPKKGEAKK